jgi:hypothetical protein
MCCGSAGRRMRALFDRFVHTVPAQVRAYSDCQRMNVKRQARCRRCTSEFCLVESMWYFGGLRESGGRGRYGGLYCG